MASHHWQGRLGAVSKVETTERGVGGWVRARYGAFARGGGSDSWCCATATSAGYATELGLYGADELAALPTAALALSRGCGNPVGCAELMRGETVVDLGCGGGIDVILAATQVGPTGWVVGIDFTPEMIEAARAALATGGLAERVELRAADLAVTGLPDLCADVVISNCVINLCPDKTAAFREAFRLLRPAAGWRSPTCWSTSRCPPR